MLSSTLWNMSNPMPVEPGLFGIATPIELWVATTIIQAIAIAKSTWELLGALRRRLIWLKQWSIGKCTALLRPELQTMVNETVDKRMVDWGDRPSRRRSNRWRIDARTGEEFYADEVKDD